MVADDALPACLAEAERAAKKQRLCADATSAALQAALDALDQARAALVASPDGGAAALRAAAATLRGPAVGGAVAAGTKDLHGAVGRLGKAIERAFVADPDRAAARWPAPDGGALDAVAANHLARSGRFRAAAALAAEAGLGDGAALVAPYVETQAVLAQMRAGNLEPALAWAAAHRAALATERGQAGADAFEFGLLRARFLQELDAEGPVAALKLARAHFGRFTGTLLPEVQRLMGRLCYGKAAGRPVPDRYASLDGPALWEAAAADFERAAAALAGQPTESPLLVVVAAGTVALPTLHKHSVAAAAVAASASGGQAAPQAADEDALAVDLDLGPEFVFRSVFSCPVSREAAGDGNPPVLLPCGHALCRASVLSIAHGPARAFKCPYCPAEATPGSCRPLRFPAPQALAHGGV